MKMKIILLAFILVTVSGCSFPVEFYLRNMTENEVRIRVLSKGNANGDEKIPFVSGVQIINADLHLQFKSVLHASDNDGDYLFFELPPLSTVYVGAGVNYHNFQYEEIVIFDGKKQITVLNWENINLLNKGKSHKKRFAWYDIR